MLKMLVQVLRSMLQNDPVFESPGTGAFTEQVATR